MKLFKKAAAVKLTSIVIISLICCWALGSTKLTAQRIKDAESLAPFVPTPMEVVEKMLELAEVKKTDMVYDLGCGDGRIVVTAAEKYGARGVGVDYNMERVNEARELAKEKKVENLVKIIYQDVMKVSFSEATVVTLYLLESSNILLQPNLEKYLKPGSRVVSHDFDMPGWTAKKVVTVSSNEWYESTIYLWIIGEHKPEKK